MLFLHQALRCTGWPLGISRRSGTKAVSCGRRGWIWFFECPGLSSLLDIVLIERWDQMEATGPDPEMDAASEFITKLIPKLPLPPSPGITLLRSVLEVYTAKPRAVSLHTHILQRHGVVKEALKWQILLLMKDVFLISSWTLGEMCLGLLVWPFSWKTQLTRLQIMMAPFAKADRTAPLLQSLETEPGPCWLYDPPPVSPAGWYGVRKPLSLPLALQQPRAGLPDCLQPWCWGWCPPSPSGPPRGRWDSHRLPFFCQHFPPSPSC